MSELFHRFSLQTAKVNWQVGLCVFLLWSIVIGCTISSIVSQPFNRQQRNFWITLVVCLPLVGLLAYLPFSFSKEELPHFFLPKSKKEKKRRSASGSSPQP